MGYSYHNQDMDAWEEEWEKEHGLAVFTQAVCADCDMLHEFWRHDTGEQVLFESVHNYPVYPHCIFGASLLASGGDPRMEIDEVACDYCGGELVIFDKED